MVLLLPYIHMNLPQVYMCSPSCTPLLPPSRYHPSGSSQCTSPSILYPASNLDWRFVSYMILYMFYCHSPKSLPPITESKRLFYTSVSLLLSRMHFFSMGMVLIPVSCTMSRTSFHSSSGTLSIRSRPLNLFLTSTV